MITVAILSAPGIAERVHALARAAYESEARWIGCDDFPPLRETVAALRGSADTFLVFEQAGNLLGALSFDPAADPVHITRLVVGPDYWRRGVATALLKELERRGAPGASFAVTTARDNVPATRLYQGQGFQIVGASISPEGIALFQLRRPVADNGL
jgi:ribosomal protein S18 acetylase RimI-like enzyme